MNKCLRNSALGVVLGLGLTTGTSGSFAAEQHNWSMALSWGGGPFVEIYAKGLAKDIEFLTEGRVKIEVFPGGTLGSPLKVTETVRNGVAEAGHHVAIYDWGIDRTAVLFGGWPGGLDSEKTLHWLYKGGGLELYQQWRDEMFDTVAFPVAVLATEVFLHSNKPARTLEDLRGMKIRTAGAWAEIAQSIGMSTVVLPGGEVYTALERGVVDATEWASLAINESMGFHKIAKYLIVPGVHSPTAVFELTINKDAWAALSERDQMLIAMAAKMATFEQWLWVGDADAGAYHNYLKTNEYIDLDPSFIAAAKKATNDWADEQANDNPWFAKVLESQRAYGQKWEGSERYRLRTSAD